MYKVGITGGIGSGKSVVCRVFETLGIPVFNADEAAKYLMENDQDLIRQIKELFGNDVYKDGKPDREKISSVVFHDPDYLHQLNALVHPATIRYSDRWLSEQTAPYCIKEAAIFFESGSNKEMDTMVGIYAPMNIRIDRVMKRSNLTRAKVEAIISMQMDEEEKMKKCDHVITNDNATAIIPQILELHDKLLKTAAVHAK